MKNCAMDSVTTYIARNEQITSTLRGLLTVTSISLVTYGRQFITFSATGSLCSPDMERHGDQHVRSIGMVRQQSHWPPNE